MNTSTYSEERKFSFDIPTRSMEETLTPLVNQITTLVSYRERPIKSDKTRQLMMQLSRALQSAIERFVSVGEKIALDHADIKYEMFDACILVRQAGAEICRHGDGDAEVAASAVSQYANGNGNGNASQAELAANGFDYSLVQGVRCRDAKSATGRPLSAVASSSALSRQRSVSASVTTSGRQLLSAICRVLLLADRVVVKQLLGAIEKVAASLSRLERCVTATDFGREFATFGDAMVNLGYLSGDRQNDLKDDVRRVQMSAARSVLEKSTTILLASAKTYLRIADSDAARRTRDCVLAHMRNALNRLETVVTQSNAAAAAAAAAANGPSAVSNGFGGEKLDKLDAPAPQSPPNVSDSALGSGDSGIVLQRASVSNAFAFRCARELERTLDHLGTLLSPHDGVLLFDDLSVRSTELTHSLHIHCETLQDALADLAESPLVTPPRRTELLAAVAHLGQLIDAADTASRAPIEHLITLGATRLTNVLDVAAADQQLALLARRTETACAAAGTHLRELLRSASELALALTCDALQVEKHTQTLLAVKLCAANGDSPQLADFLARFEERGERLTALARPLRHIAAHDVLVAACEHTFAVLRTLSQLVCLSADTLVQHTGVRQARELLDAVCDTFQQQLLDVASLAKDIGDAQHARWSLDAARLPVLRQLTRTQSVLSLQRAAGSRAPTPSCAQPPNGSASSTARHSTALAHVSQPNVNATSVTLPYAPLDPEANSNGPNSTGYAAANANTQRMHAATLGRSAPRAAKARSSRPSPQLSLIDINEPSGEITNTITLTPQLLIRTGISQNVQLHAKARILDELAQPTLQFAASRGPLRTTHELFVQCARFCDELAQFNRVLRASLATLASQLAALPLTRVSASSTSGLDGHGEQLQRPTSDAHYQLLLFESDRLSTLVQQLNSTLRVQTAGRVQTFQKVDSLIQLIRAAIQSVRNKILLADGDTPLQLEPMGVFDQRTSTGSLQNDAASSCSDGGPLRSTASLQRSAAYAYGPLVKAGSVSDSHSTSRGRNTGALSNMPLANAVSDDEVAYGERLDGYASYSRMNLRSANTHTQSVTRPQPTQPAYFSSGSYSTTRPNTNSHARTGSGQYVALPSQTTATMPAPTPTRMPPAAINQNTQRLRSMAVRTSSQEQDGASNGSPPNMQPRTTTRMLARARSEEQSSGGPPMSLTTRHNQNAAVNRLPVDSDEVTYLAAGTYQPKRDSSPTRTGQMDRV